MKLGIIGTRGIPNEYGGFEQFAEHFSTYAASKGIEVTVYCSSNQTFKDPSYKGVRLIHCKDPEPSLGSFGQFIYDLNCIRHSRTEAYDIILQLGYTSNAIWNFLYPIGSKIITNMDGMEWKRTKYNSLTRLFLKGSEQLVVRYSDHLIADSEGILKYLESKYKKPVSFVPYGAVPFHLGNPEKIAGYGLKPEGYNLTIARFEPENNIEMIIQGHLKSSVRIPLVVVGNTSTPYGHELKEKYASEKVRFTEGIFQAEQLNHLRSQCNLYFHGHSVGGTNPSLLEAMAASACIAAHNNPFNKAVLQYNAFYFSSAEEVAGILQNYKGPVSEFTRENLNRIQTVYNWDKQNGRLLDLMQQIHEK
jgi:hypothetical protein